MWRPTYIAVAIATVALAVAFAIDAPVATAVHNRAWDQKHRDLVSHVRETIKLLGFFPTTLALALLAARLHPQRWVAGVFLLLATLPAALNAPIKFIAGRLRPFKAPNIRADEWTAEAEPFRFHGFHASNNLSFPSGHAALAFATAMAFSILFPRGRNWFFAGAVIVGLERITENAHWCSDVVAAAILGIGGAATVRWFLDRRQLLKISSAAHGQLD